MGIEKVLVCVRGALASFNLVGIRGMVQKIGAEEGFKEADLGRCLRFLSVVLEGTSL
jgi:hypothetical protein